MHKPNEVEITKHCSRGDEKKHENKIARLPLIRFDSEGRRRVGLRERIYGDARRRQKQRIGARGYQIIRADTFHRWKAEGRQIRDHVLVAR